MKKLQAVFLALLMVSALAAVFAGSASAEETLLAEWLVSGSSIIAPATEASVTSGSITLEDTGVGAAVLCTATLEGALAANGASTVTKILNLAKEEISSTPLSGLALLGPTPDCVSTKLCSTTAAIEVWPVGLPWAGTLFLDAATGKILELIAKTTPGFGYELICTILGLKVEDKCESTDSTFEIINDADTGDASAPSGALGEPLANCSRGGTETGANITDELTPITLTSGLLLTVSSE